MARNVHRGGMTASSNDKRQNHEIQRDKNADNSLLLFKQLTRTHQLRATESAAADAKKHPQTSSHESALGSTNTFSAVVTVSASSMPDTWVWQEHNISIIGIVYMYRQMTIQVSRQPWAYCWVWFNCSLYCKLVLLTDNSQTTQCEAR